MARRTPIQLYPIYPVHAPPPLPKLATVANPKFALGSITSKLTYIVVAQGFEPMAGIKSGTALLLTFANTTKPLRIQLYLIYPAHSPPRPNQLR